MCLVVFIPIALSMSPYQRWNQLQLHYSFQSGSEYVIDGKAILYLGIRQLYYKKYLTVSDNTVLITKLINILCRLCF